MVSDMVLSGNGQQLVAESHNEYLLREKIFIATERKEQRDTIKALGT